MEGQRWGESTAGIILRHKKGKKRKRREPCERTIREKKKKEVKALWSFWRPHENGTKKFKKAWECFKTLNLWSNEWEKRGRRGS